MNYSLEISDEADKKFKKLSEKNKKRLNIIYKKIKEILKNPFHYKPLKGDLHGARRFFFVVPLFFSNTFLY